MHPIKENFINSLLPGQGFELFNQIPGICFFAKNTKGTLVAMNQLFAERCGFESEDELVGKSDFEIFPANLAEKYAIDDQTIIQTGKPISHLVELFPNRLGVPEWFITNKIPLRNNDNKVCGVAGTVQTYEESKSYLQPYLKISKAVEYIKSNYKEAVTIPFLAKMVGLSVRQFQQHFKNTFQTSPQNYLIKIRLLSACDMLLHSDLSITQIAIQVGFYDHSSFTRQFNKHLGLTPLKYKKKYLNLKGIH